ncbi:MAG: hypothetical protein QXU46_02415 [Candidatus Bathyarchaeia archaeon]
MQSRNETIHQKLKTNGRLLDFKHNAFWVSSTDLSEIKKQLEEICSEIALRYNLSHKSGKPRKSTIIEVIAKSPCLACVTKKLSGQSAASDVEALYKECHKLAVNVLVEELYYLLNQMNYKVLISTEAELQYGKVDILITVTNYGLSLKNSAKELLVEVKTGNSFSLTQIFRYLLDSKSEDIIVWRIRKRQVLVFNVNEIKPLLTEFTRMLCLRGIRLLSSQQIQPCQHELQRCHQPKQEELEEMFRDFSKALIETLPSILQIIIEKLGISTLQSHGNTYTRMNEGTTSTSQGDEDV